MSNTSLTLSCPEGSLEFHSKENNWCSVFLVAEDKRTELGADTKAIVCNRILDALNIHSNVGKRNSPKHLIDGKEFFWMISLSEKHSSGYIAFDVSGCDIDFNRAKLNGSVKYIYQPSKWLIGKIKLDFGLVELLIMQ